jgi:hypothetical protein
MLNAKRWLILCLLITSSILFLLTATNYIVDPYGFNKERSKNTFFTTPFKANIVSHNPFNAIMLGTSRTGVMNPDVVNKYLRVNAFNLSYPSANTEIQNRLFKYAYHFNPKIKYLIYGIDFGCFNERRYTKKFKEFYDQKEKIENKEQLSAFDLYFNFNTFTSSVEGIINMILGEDKLEAQYLRRNGMLDYVNYIKDLKNGRYDLDTKIKQSIQVFFQKEGVYKDYSFSKIFLNEFKDILKFCEEKNIKVFVYIPPVYSDHIDAIAKAGYYDEFEFFKRELVKVTDYIDFTGHNPLSTNKANFWDTSHLRKELTETIILRVLNANNPKFSNDFGKLVTQNNIDEHLVSLREEIQDYDLDKVLSGDFK